MFDFDDTTSNETMENSQLGDGTTQVDHMLVYAQRRGVCFAETYLITPTIAEAMLQRNNTNNRIVRKSKVREYSQQLRDGDWLMSGEPVIFNTDSVLDNGQHRLLAIIDTGIAANILVTFNADPKAFAVYDTGLKRTAADAFRHQGYKNETDIPASLRALSRIEQSEGRGTVSLNTISLFKYIEKHPDIEHCVVYGQRLNSQFRLSKAGATAGFYWIKMKTDMPRERLEEFWQALITGANLDANSPILTLRNRFSTRQKGTSGDADRACVIAAMIVLCWNAWLKNPCPKRKQNLEWVDRDVFPIPS